MRQPIGTPRRNSDRAVMTASALISAKSLLQCEDGLRVMHEKVKFWSILDIKYIISAIKCEVFVSKAVYFTKDY